MSQQQISEADLQRVLQIIAESLNTYTAAWKSPAFAALADGSWGTNRELISGQRFGDQRTNAITNSIFDLVGIPMTRC